jgi:hypothetical protein
LLEQIVAVLRWQQRSFLPAALYAELVERLAGAYHSALSRSETTAGSRVAALRAQVRACPPVSLLRLLTAPEAFRRFSSATAEPDEVLAFIEESVAAELHRCGQGLPVDRSAWTALGDYHALGAADGCSETGSDDRAKVAPLAGEIPVDFDSPYAFGADMPGSGNDLPILAINRDQLVAMLDGVVCTIGEASPRALALVRLFTRVIVPCSNLESRSFLSSSSPRLVGKTVLSNAEFATREMLAEALVHESIHALLSAEQLRMPFVLDHGDVSAETVTSPWTGARIPMDAFVDACFIWFALWNFWSLPAASMAFNHPELERLRQRSRSGFDGPSLARLLVGHERALSPDVLDAVAAMQHAVQCGRPRAPV